MTGEQRFQLTNGRKCRSVVKLSAMFGCQVKPTSQCPECSNHYCYGHIKMHIHVTDENPFGAGQEERMTKLRAG